MSRPSPAIEKGLVIANFGRGLLVEAQDGTHHPCAARRGAVKAVCGDQVRWQAQDDGSGVVLEIAPRRTVLTRPDQRGTAKPLCANIDQIVVVAAVQEGDTRPRAGERMRIDAYLAAAELLGIGAIVLVNKIDLLTAGDAGAMDAGMAPWRTAGYAVLYTSTLKGEGIADLERHLAGHRSVFVGESGMGKSSLAQVLLPDREIRIGALSAASGKGRHTTTVSLLFHLPGGGDIIDSPGVREFRLGNVAAADLAGAFPELRGYLGACRYRDCRHLDEPACAVAAAADDGLISRERLESYRGLLLSMQDDERGAWRVTR